MAERRRERSERSEQAALIRSQTNVNAGKNRTGGATELRPDVTDAPGR